MYDVLCAAARKLADLAGLTDADLQGERHAELTNLAEVPSHQEG